MAVTASRILAPATNLYYGVTNPASNTFLAIVAGVPGTGTHCGAIGQIGIAPGVETTEKDSENQIAALGASITKHTLEITVRLREWTTEGLSWLMPGRTSGGGFFGGGSSDLAYNSVTVIWTLSEDDGEYALFHAYKCYVSSPASIEPSKSSCS